MRIRSVKLAWALLLAFSLGTALSLCAQSTNTGTVLGTITDPSGAVVPGASITLSQIGTSSVRTTVTNDAGKYFFANVDPGQYRITLTKQGFDTTKSQAEVKVGQSTTLNLTLQVGTASTTVEVQATGTELQTLNATVGNTLNSTILDNLPSLGREVNTFIELQPGVAPDGSVGGAVVDQSYFSLDGGNNSNDMDGSGGIYQTTLAGDPTGGVAAQWTAVFGPSGTVPTPQDSVEEFKVDTAGQTADFDSSAGAEIKIVTKRGTDAWHGTAYEYYKDNNWSSNSWQNDAYGVALPSFHYSRYGGAVGGPLIPKKVLGGKTYFFFNYEGFNYPAAETIYKSVPSAAMRSGLIQDTAGNFYNLNPYAVTYNGNTYPATANDPQHLGITPLLSANANNSANPGSGLWDKYEPASNAACNPTLLLFCDGTNIQGFSANLSLPQTSKFFVGRLDHDFSKNWHLMSSYRYFSLQNATDAQVDIGGFFPGDTLGVPKSLSTSPAQPWFLVAGLTTNITPNVTNDFHYSLTRNWWAYIRQGDIPQFPGLGAALEVESGQGGGQNNSLTPYNVNNQDTRNRFWDGHDNMFRDDLSMLHGNHLFQFGGIYQRNFDWHQRTDNGGQINNQPVYDLGLGSKSNLTADILLCGPQGTPGAATATITNCPGLTAAVLGAVSTSEVVLTRSGPSLNLQPIGTPAQARSTIPFYNVYFSDTWHLRPSLTLTYGLGYALEMPPTEQNGEQVTMVDQAGQIVSAANYLKQREKAALQGINYNPEIGYALLANAANSPKYPYTPYYGEFSPRIAFAWAPTAATGLLSNTVVRAGYGRQYGRLNGVNQVLVPLLAPGILQPVECFGNLNTGACASGATASNVFRIGPSSGGPLAFSGLSAPLLTLSSPTLPQPYYPGFNAPTVGPGEYLDPNYRPNAIDAFDVTIQRQLSRKITLEMGYIGRRITHEYLPISLNSVPYMMTQGGQTFANAYANVVMQYCGGVAGLAGGNCAASASAVVAQPFFENAMKPSYCAGASSCTAAVVGNEGFNIANAQVWSLWSDLDGGVSTNCGTGSTCAGQGFIFGNTMMNTNGGSFGPQSSSGVASNTSEGSGNYNAGFVSVKSADWRGITMQSNFTYAKALGMGAVVQASSEYTADNPYDLKNFYGVQPYNRKFVFNDIFVYQPPFFKGQHGLLGRALGGWTISSIFAAGSGTPVEVYPTLFSFGQEFGAADAINYGDNANVVPIGPLGAHGHAYYNVPSTSYPVNFFKAGPAAAMNWRNPILGYDSGRDGGAGALTGLPYWNLDASVKKDIRVAENVSMEFQGVFVNILNHNQWLDPTGLGVYSPGSFGSLGGEAQETPGGNRQIELGARVRF
jgi:Carboxypeptidase regulatory-like domain